MKNEEKKNETKPVDLNKADAGAEKLAEPAEAKTEKKSEAAETKPKKKLTLNRKKIKYGGLATAITAIFIAAVVLLNVVVSTVMDRYPLKLDLTSD